MTQDLTIELDEIIALRKENAKLKQQLESLKNEKTNNNNSIIRPLLPEHNGEIKNNRQADETLKEEDPNTFNGLTLHEYQRYGRQLIVSEFGGPESQKKLKDAKVLVVGAGGLGCPALLYLAAAGIGTIGIIDPDTVDVSNLHRQVLHSTSRVGQYKAESAKAYLTDLNPTINITTFTQALSNENCFDVVSQFDLVLDCTDTPMVRYLINDACVLSGKTIVSGSGVRTEGQLSILNFKNYGPCYRCYYPKPPLANNVTSCSDGGVIGPCIGLVGTMMAVEAIKVLIDWYNETNFKPFLTCYNGFNAEQASQSLRTFTMRNKLRKCLICTQKEITKEKVLSREIDYNVFCGNNVDRYNVITTADQISAKDFASQYYFHNNEGSKSKNLFIDCRPKEHFNVAHLEKFVHFPLAQLQRMDTVDELPEDLQKAVSDGGNVFVICRFGNDSRIMTKVLKDKFNFKQVKDIKGGLKKWSLEVDEKFPVY